MAPASLSQPTTLEAEPAWQPSPMGRGTIDLLKSCVFTLILCVWTAVHPDVPARKYNSMGWNLLRRFLWMVVGFLAPEVVLWVALSQYLAARKICPDLKKLIDEKISRGKESLSRTQSRAGAPIEVSDDPDLLNQEQSTPRGVSSREQEDGQNDHGWGEKGSWFEKRLSRALAPLYPREMTLSLYIVMGGFGIEVEIPQLAPKARPHISQSIELRLLSAKTVLGAIKCDVITLDQLNPNAIKDRSKADLLSKFILLLQACWMIVQCIARRANSIPLTLLEYNTLMHVVATLLMYVLWLKKPQDTNFPTLVRPGTRAARAYFLGNLIDPQRRRFGPKRRQYIDRGREMKDMADKETLVIPKAVYSNNLHRELQNRKWESIEVDYRPIEKRAQRDICAEDPRSLKLTKNDIDILYWMFRPTGSESEGKCCWTTTYDGYFFERDKLELKERQVLMHEGSIDPLIDGSGKEAIFICALTALYGAVHLIPWNSHFPSGWEQYLWRIACAIVAGGATTMLTAIFGFEWIIRKLSGIWKTMFDIALLSILLGMVVVYTIARAFIFVEAFISLRSLPKGAYSTVNWVEFLPHL